MPVDANHGQMALMRMFAARGSVRRWERMRPILLSGFAGGRRLLFGRSRGCLGGLRLGFASRGSLWGVSSFVYRDT